MASSSHSSGRQIPWKDCETGTEYALDTRTGLMHRLEQDGSRSTRPRLSMPSNPNIRESARNTALSLRRVTSRVFDRAESLISSSSSVGSFARPVLPNDADITALRLAGATLIRQVDRKMLLVLCHPTQLAAQEKPQLVLIDQHAADERVRLERILVQLTRNTAAHTVALTPPWSWPVTPAEESRLCTHARWFESFGITTSTTSGTVHVSTLPACIYERAWEDPNIVLLLLKQDSLLRGAATAAIMPASLGAALAFAPPSLAELIKSQACRSAVMFNDYLGDSACRTLLSSLAACENPFRCVHNRPTMVRIAGGPGTIWEGDLGSLSA